MLNNNFMSKVFLSFAFFLYSYCNLLKNLSILLGKSIINPVNNYLMNA